MNPLYRNDTYLASAESKIAKVLLTEANETAFIFRDLAFYPGGGGQPAEVTGTILLRGQAYPIKALAKEQGDVVVVLRERLPFHDELRKGESVLQQVDMDFRLRASRTHSVQHILGAATRLTVPGYETLGMEIASDLTQCEMHFHTDLPLTEGMIAEIAGRAQSAIVDDLPIRTEINESIEAVRAKYGDVFRIAPSLTEWRSNRLRTIVIGEDSAPVRDVCFCGGTHIKSLAEVGAFEISEYGHDTERNDSYLIFRLL